MFLIANQCRSICSMANEETRTTGLVGSVSPQMHFFGMSCSIKNAFQRPFLLGITHKILTHCEAFDVFTTVSKFTKID